MVSFVRHLLDLAVRNPGRSSTIMAWANQGISMLANLLLVPLILHQVGTATAGIWFFLLGWTGLIGILDFGFSQCISRQITFSFGKKGFLSGRPKGRFIRLGGPRTIGSTIAASKSLFRIVSVIILIFGVLAERTFLFTGRMQTGTDAHICWYFIILSAVTSNENRVYGTALSGMLLIPHLRLIQLLQTLLQNSLIAGMLVLSPRLEWMGAAILASGIIAQACLRSLWNRRRPPGIIMSPAKWSVIGCLWRSSWEQGVASASAYFIFAVNPLLIGYLLGPTKAAVYYLPFRISTILFSSIAEIFGPQTNFMISEYRDHNIRGMLVRFFRFFIVAGTLSFLAFGAFAVAGPWAVGIWSLGKISPPAAVFWIMALYYFVAMIQTMLALFITAHGMQPFAKPAVAGAALNLTLTYFLVPFMGLTGAALATFLAQALTSNWYIPWYAVGLFREHFQQVPFAVAWRDAVGSLRGELVKLGVWPRGKGSSPANP
jgi:O-antigen/teichoic acid export membrane protein